MAKKREVKEQTTPPPAPSQIEEHDLERGEEKAYYSVGLWANLPQYVCNACGFDTLDPRAMQEHLFWTHSVMVEMEGTPLTPIPGPSPISKTEMGEGIYDSDDEEVFEVELEEIGSTVDEQGNDHKTFTVKEK